MPLRFDELTPETINVLRSIYQSGIARGAELKDEVRLQPAAFLTSVQQLRDADLLAVSGNMNDPSKVLESYFSIMPSASGIVRSLLQKR
jgi:hypothetical protein